MLHMKWLALHHCLWEWSSGEALGSLGQPLWFVLMFWFHNPNILRAVICSLFPFYSVILLLFFSRAKLSTERRSSFKWETEKGWKRRRRRETGRRELDGERAKSKTTQTESASKFVTCITCGVKLHHATCPYASIHSCVVHAWVYISLCMRRKKRSVWLKDEKQLATFSPGTLAHSSIPNHSTSKVYLYTDSLRSEQTTSEAASTMWLAYCNSSLLLASACATEMTCISESVPLWEVPTGSSITGQTSVPHQASLLHLSSVSNRACSFSNTV